MRKAIIILCSLLPLVGLAQEPANDWYFGEFNKKQLSGIGLDEALELVSDQKAEEIIVAVIDAGVDVYHPDLQGQLWINSDEIADNGIDDDNNGYIDDVYGWNFIGGADSSVGYDTYELTRQYVSLKEKYGMTASSIDDEEEYQRFIAIREEFKTQRNEAKQYFEFFKQVQLGIADLEEIYGEDISLEELENHQSSSRNEELARLMLYVTAKEMKEAYDYNDIKTEFTEAYDHYDYLFNYGYNPSFDPRDIVGDNYNDASERNYGNNVVYYGEKFSSHGTHVAGIIAANRMNDEGAMGVCQTARIMSLRAVPNGDERDKDIANSIYYAVDNGAKIINMSFGKGYAHNTQAVKEAIAYAKSKQVLLVHGAGNDAENNDITDNFPNDNEGEFQSIWLEVGASSWEKSPHMLASFSNYGEQSVDLFAPGVSIYSTMPEESYEASDGTSMASPVVAGVAALIWSYFPEFTAEEVRQIIIDSATPISCKQKIPGSKKKSKVASLSQTGAMVNAHAAMQLALERARS